MDMNVEIIVSIQRISFHQHGKATPVVTSVLTLTSET